MSYSADYAEGYDDYATDYNQDYGEGEGEGEFEEAYADHVDELEGSGQDILPSDIVEPGQEGTLAPEEPEPTDEVDTTPLPPEVEPTEDLSTTEGSNVVTDAGVEGGTTGPSPTMATEDPDSIITEGNAENTEGTGVTGEIPVMEVEGTTPTTEPPVTEDTIKEEEAADQEFRDGRFKPVGRGPRVGLRRVSR